MPDAQPSHRYRHNLTMLELFEIVGVSLDLVMVLIVILWRIGINRRSPLCCGHPTALAINDGVNRRSPDNFELKIPAYTSVLTPTPT